MTLLPIAHRELLVSARKKSVRRSRIFFALGAVAIAGALGLISLASKGSFSSELGVMIFESLKWSAFIFACAGGIFLTSDCLSEEKREGTFGLLFLTNLRGYDVVLGKLFATSLRCFYSLLAIFPIMAFSFVLGGVAADDFRGSIISICNTLFFSLALGMLISAASRETHRAMTAAAVALVVFLFLIPELDLCVLGRNSNQPVLRLLSPLFGVNHTDNYHSRDFWASTLAIHVLGWVWLLIASLLAPASWRDKGARQKGSRQQARNPIRPWLAPVPKRELLDSSPVAWIVLRDRWAANLARVALGLALAMLVLSVCSSWQQPAAALASVARRAASPAISTTTTSNSTSATMTFGSSVAIGMRNNTLFQFASSCASALSIALELWLVMHIVRFYIEGRRTGFFELLLVTPITMREVLSGQWIALRKLFFAPVAAQVLLALAIGAVPILAIPAGTGAWRAGNLVTSTMEFFILAFTNVTWITGLFSLAWMAIWMGQTSNKTTMAVLKTICYTKILPWIGVSFTFGLTFLVLMNFIGIRSLTGVSPNATAVIFRALPQLVPSLFMLLVNMILIRVSRRRVQGAFSNATVAAPS